MGVVSSSSHMPKIQFHPTRRRVARSAATAAERKKVPDGGCSRCGQDQDAATVGVRLSSHGSQLHKHTNVSRCVCCAQLCTRPFPWIYAAFHAHRQRPCNCCKHANMMTGEKATPGESSRTNAFVRLADKPWLKALLTDLL